MALVCKSLHVAPTGVATPAEISRGDTRGDITLQVGASKGEQATLKMIQSGYCVACAAGKSALALEPFMHANRPDSTHSLSHALSPHSAHLPRPAAGRSKRDQSTLAR